MANISPYTNTCLHSYVASIHFITIVFHQSVFQAPTPEISRYHMFIRYLVVKVARVRRVREVRGVAITAHPEVAGI